MKKILSILTITAVFAACNSNPKTGTDTATSVTTADTATSNHNAFTDKAQEVQLNGVSDTIVGNDGNAYVKVKPKEALVAPVPERATVRHHTTTRTSRTGTSAGGSGTSKSESSTSTSTSSTGTSGSTGTTSTTPVPEKKKGWSKAAKGAVIGAGTGAAAGAIFSKNKAKGAVIGGVIGGAGGYIFGRSKDKKDGRYLVDTTKSKF